MKIELLDYFYRTFKKPKVTNKESIDTYSKYGSYKFFKTECYINGGYFRFRTKNQYYQIINKNSTIKEIENLTFFVPSNVLAKKIQQWGYNSNKHYIVRLEIVSTKAYYVNNSNQYINVEKPDVVVLTDIDIEEFLNNLPKFIPIKDK